MDHVYYMLTAMILGAVSSPADNLYNLLLYSANILSVRNLPPLRSIP
jgi:hypothetical protein